MNIEYIHIQSADQIQILNAFVVSNLTEYEYWIYSVLANWPKMNIEYIHNQKIEYLYSNILIIEYVFMLHWLKMIYRVWYGMSVFDTSNKVRRWGQHPLWKIPPKYIFLNPPL